MKQLALVLILIFPITAFAWEKPVPYFGDTLEAEEEEFLLYDKIELVYYKAADDFPTDGTVSDGAWDGTEMDATVMTSTMQIDQSEALLSQLEAIWRQENTGKSFVLWLVEKVEKR